MRRITLLLAVLIIVTTANRPDACEGPFVRQGVLSDLRPGLPNRAAVRVIATVTGYGSTTRVVGKRLDVDQAATLRVRVQEVISGKISTGEADVVPLFHASNCNSQGQTRDFLQERYKIGTSVAVFGESIPAFIASTVPAIVAEENQGGSVWVIPNNLKRTVTSELDFSHLDRTVDLGHVLEFEFDRALLRLANSPPRERFGRLENLADYPYSFHAFRQADREFFSRLVSESGVTPAEARRLLDRFDRR